MVIAIIGENCAGKSTLAQKIKEKIGAEVYSGRDYLRLSKSETDARRIFCSKLESAVHGENIIYVISDKEHLSLIPEGAVRILVRADLDTIKARFRARMGGNLPLPVEQMLERKHGTFDDGTYDIVIENAEDEKRLWEMIEGL